LTKALARNIIDHARSGLGRQAIRQEVDVGGSVVDAVVRAWETAGKPDDPAAVIADLLERRRVGLARLRGFAGF
jgi:hypothetical protein